MQNLTYLLLGIRDSLSIGWIKNVLLYSHPQTGELHPESRKLFDTGYRTIVQVILIYILLPVAFNYLATYSAIIKVLYYYAMMLVTILTYGYTFFYFTDVFDAANAIVRWNRKNAKQIGTPFVYGELEDVEKIGIFRGVSNKIKSFIFLACYGVFYIIAMAILIHIPYFGRLNLIISEAFFNGIFYFFRKWPYDDFNIGFFQKKWAYLTGFGLTVSIICNFVFQDYPLLQNGAYFLLSPSLIINMIVSSPPDLQITSFNDLISTLSTPRHTFKNSYNTHRNNLKNQQYQIQVVNEIMVLKPIITLTKYIQNKLQVLKEQK